MARPTPRRRPRSYTLPALGVLVLVTYTVTLVRLQPALDEISAAPQPQPQQQLRHADAAFVHFHKKPRSQLEQQPPTTTEPEALTPEAIRRKKREKLTRRCFRERDYGMVPLLQRAQRTLCDDAARVDPALAGNLSTYVHYDSDRAGLRSTMVTNLWVDLRNARVFKPIANRSQDGHLHDPRFQHDSVDAYCVCDADQDHTLENGVRVWGLIHGDHPEDAETPWQFCRAFSGPREIEALRSGVASVPWNKTLLQLQNESYDTSAGEEPAPPQRGPPVTSWPFPVRYVTQNAIIVARRDDHNPFFQISVALNAWIMMKVLDWSPLNTQLVYFDDGLPATTDELQRRILSPVHPVLLGRELMGSVVHFERVMVAPFEYSGPLMRHLDDNEPCGRNKLVQDFRDLVMTKYGVETVKRDPKTCTITVISRRPYQGRMVQRKWLNEEAILERMRLDYEYNSAFYKYGTCRIQAYDFVGLSLEQQMQTIVESDVIVGMHGAGMANVLWSRADTVVAEIFPFGRKRYGYRNMCKFIGCKWHEFRNGTDTGTGDNTSDKIISYADWYTFFDPIVRAAIRSLEARVASTLRRLSVSGDE